MEVRYKFWSGDYRQLELIAKKRVGPYGSVTLYHSSGRESYFFKYQGYEACQMQLCPGCEYELEIKDVEVSIAYLCGQDYILEEGIGLLKFENGQMKQLSGEGLSEVYSQPFRNQIHFSPVCGWMNDPNGLCWFKGYYHLFYQYNPNGFQWGNMHWGHCVSRDLVHWTHLPIVSYPQIELLDNNDFRGGAFSGSAAVSEGRMQLFFTRHFGRNDRSWQRQWQVSCQTEDGVHFTAEETVIWGTPEGVFYDFRDPKVEKDGEVWRMVLGGTVWGIPSVLCYESSDLRTWSYQGILYQETDPNYGVSECPDFFHMGTEYSLIVGYINGKQVRSGKRRDTRYYLGTLENGMLRVKSSGLLDSGKDFYAAQSFWHAGRRICIGWNCGDGIGPSEEGANGTASIPRELSVEKGRLFMRPVREIYDLIDRPLAPCAEQNGFYCPAQPPLYIKLEQMQGSCELTLADDGKKQLRLRVHGTEAELETGADDFEEPCRFQLTQPVQSVELFLDKALIEIFFNGGEEVCTRRYYIANQTGQIKAAWSSNAPKIEIYSMRGIYDRGRNSVEG